MKIALGALVAGSPVFKILIILVDFLKKLWINSGLLNKLFQSGLGLWQRMVDFFSWLLNSIKSGVQWIKDGLGLTKAEKEKAMDEIAEKEGVYWSDKKGTWVTKESGGTATATPSPRLARAQEEYLNAPDSVFSKIGEVIPGAISSIVKLFDPVLNPLKTAIEDLVAWLDTWFGIREEPATDIINPETGIGQQGDTITGSGESSGTGGIETPRQFYSTAPSREFGKFDVLKGSTVIATYDTEAEAKQHVANLSTPAPAMTAGGQIRATGSLIGHGGEEMDPARVVAGGKTTLARINEMFSGGSASPLASPTITIQAPPVNINIGRVEKDVDIDRLFKRAGEEFDRKLLFRLRNSLNTMGLRDIGYMRG
jgi:hypothetical protein